VSGREKMSLDFLVKEVHVLRIENKRLREAAEAVVKDAGRYSDGIPQSRSARALYDVLRASE